MRLGRGIMVGGGGGVWRRCACAVGCACAVIAWCVMPDAGVRICVRLRVLLCVLHMRSSCAHVSALAIVTGLSCYSKNLIHMNERFDGPGVAAPSQRIAACRGHCQD